MAELYPIDVKISETLDESGIPIDKIPRRDRARARGADLGQYLSTYEISDFTGLPIASPGNRSTPKGMEFYRAVLNDPRMKILGLIQDYESQIADYKEFMKTGPETMPPADFLKERGKRMGLINEKQSRARNIIYSLDNKKTKNNSPEDD